MEIKNLSDLVEELVANGVDCAYVEKFNSIFINDNESPKYTRSIYEKNGKFLINVKIKAKPTKDHSPAEKTECYLVKDEWTDKLNALGVYKFPVFQPATTAPVKAKVADENDPFADLDLS
jgi:hypothetical protein